MKKTIQVKILDSLRRTHYQIVKRKTKAVTQERYELALFLRNIGRRLRKIIRKLESKGNPER
jgi:hypothetical protein